MTVKAIFSSGRCSSLYTVFAALIVYKRLDTILAATKCIGIVIGGIIVAIIVIFIY